VYERPEWAFKKANAHLERQVVDLIMELATKSIASRAEIADHKRMAEVLRERREDDEGID
jgi:C4-dicarboxylate-specific signal transduction histidine kinase